MAKKEILNDRTYVEIHMMQTIDGKATGNFWRKPDVWAGIKDYHELIPELNNQALPLEGFQWQIIAMKLQTSK